MSQSTSPNLGLIEIQRLFWDAIRYPTGISEYLSSQSPERRRQFDAIFAETPDFPRIERMQVYAEAYFYRLLDVLAEMYPVVRHCLGADAFHNLVTDYLLRHPSRDPDLHRLGDRLPAYLIEHPTAQAMPYLVDFAHIESALTFALDAPDDELLTAAHLAKLAPTAWPTLRLALATNARISVSRWDFLPIHERMRARQPPITPHQLPTPQHILVWRKSHRSHFRPLTTWETTFARAAEQHASFEQICQLAETRGHTPADVVTTLQRWLGDEVLRDVGVRQEEVGTTPHRKARHR